ncbi:protein serine/threonine kinase, putative [Entamoeba invadens IP1]|uniref:Protein serine/threonine kinase, putative n=1 Tax=Entamoeba invadens IP1 TaxID=370355 RepID=A0A0A1U8L8_ENTIV|nr:protein serine/threonine kinase, putative [Entamoeba invadens IP1]ELP88328.1 protein serine/threonine kinase, putative [Entamoeba invadens IP1]|eukprot:XP_004255099.1 protein serine/threonine kinase, putative [Entamoeba invadens IP1]
MFETFLLTVLCSTLSLADYNYTTPGWCKNDNSIYYDYNKGVCTLRGWNIISNDDSSVQQDNITFTLQADSVMVFNSASLKSDAIYLYTRHFKFDNGNKMNSLLFVNRDKPEQNIIHDTNRPNGLYIGIGCYDWVTPKNVACRTTAYENARTIVDIHYNGVLLYSDINEKFILNIWRYSNQTNPVQLYIEGDVSQDVTVQLKNFPSRNDYNKANYIFTGKNIYNINLLNGSNQYITRACTRNAISRFILLSSNNPVIDCDCIPDNATVATAFNYPDCQYNNSYFVINLSKLEATNNIVTTIFEQSIWYSLYVNVRIQYLITSTNDTLSFNIITVRENTNVLFNTMVQTDTIEITGSANFTFAKGVDVTTIIITNNTADKFVLFYVHEEFTIPDGVDRCGYRVIKSDTPNRSTLCSCTFDSNGYDSFDCSLNIYKSGMYLTIDSTNYRTVTQETWIDIIQNQELTIPQGTSLLATHCTFPYKMDVFGNINCLFVSLSELSNVTLKNGSSFNVNSLTFTKTSEFINENGIIKIESGSLFDTKSSTITIEYFNDVCVDLISFKEQKMISFTHGNYYNNKLLRVCGGTDTNKIICKMSGEKISESSSFIYPMHCPIYTNSSLFKVESEKLTIDRAYNGYFELETPILSLSNKMNNQNIQIMDNSLITKSVLHFTDDSLETTIDTLDYKEKLLISNKFKFGDTSKNTQLDKSNHRIKSATQVISVSESNICKAYYLINKDGISTKQCLICDELLYNGNCYHREECITTTNMSICEECQPTYEVVKSGCLSCRSKCRRCVSGTCIQCMDGYGFNETNECLLNGDNIENFNNKVLYCKPTFYFKKTKCDYCGDNCASCYYDMIIDKPICTICTSPFVLENDTCILENVGGVDIIRNTQITSCKRGFYILDGKCIGCHSFGESCKYCNSKQCLQCVGGNVDAEGKCQTTEISKCVPSTNTYCTKCVSTKDYISNSKCVENELNCSVVKFDGSKCDICSNSLLLLNGKCIKRVDNSTECDFWRETEDVCLRCELGKYYEPTSLSCDNCSTNCLNCFNSTKCLGCEEGYLLANGSCTIYEAVSSHCIKVVPLSSFCAICEGMYYRTNEGVCEKCISNCDECISGDRCTICGTNFYLLSNATKCVSFDALTNCDIKTSRGCSYCSSGYYLEEQTCFKCDQKTTFCEKCSQSGRCNLCVQNYILKNDECVSKIDVDNCVEVSNSKCVKCTFWHVPTDEGTGCKTHVVWWVLFIVIVIFLIFILLIIFAIFRLNLLIIKMRRNAKLRKQFSIFDMKHSNIQFVSTNTKGVVVSEKVLLFETSLDKPEIPVEVESRELICVGNTSKSSIKVQFSMKDDCEKYSMRTVPQIMTIPKGKALEFEVFLTPHCGGTIEDKIILISVCMKNGVTSQVEIQIKGETEISTRIDEDELIEEKKIGQGSFGIVYKGVFRGNQVAIKKMKSVTEGVEDFEKEVAMLEKFRSDYIVHFYGAVMLKKKRCLVTEFAPFGSLEDLIEKTTDCSPVEMSMRDKFMLDAAQGILYLHSNGIIHRDIKPDNILIMSLDQNNKVNAKLTDFGSSRNINMLMTNMTFTKGIGTPKFMAPEVLNKQKYKKEADIFSFGVTLFECYKWGEAYPKNEFKYAWNVVEFIMSGKRLAKHVEMNDERYGIISKCWETIPNERLTAQQVVDMLSVHVK